MSAIVKAWGLILWAVNGVWRSFASRFAERISIAEFGAVADAALDGLSGTDCADAFDAAAAALQSWEKLHVPSGDWLISRSIELPEGFEIEFSANARIVYTGAAGTACFTGGALGARYSGLRLIRPKILATVSGAIGIKVLNPVYNKIHDYEFEGVPQGDCVGLWWACGGAGVDGAWNHLSGQTRLNHCLKGIFSPIRVAPYDGWPAQWVVDYLVFYGDHEVGVYESSIAVDMGGGANSVFKAGYVEQCGKGFALSGDLSRGIRVTGVTFDHCYEIANLSSDATGDCTDFRMTGCYVDAGWENYTDTTAGGTNYLEFAYPKQFIGTLTGCTTAPTVTIKYVKVGRMVTVSMTGALSAVSNATTKTITGVPAEITPTFAQYMIANVSDNGGAQQMALARVNTGNTFAFWPNPTGNAWTASGTMRIEQFTWTYIV